MWNPAGGGENAWFCCCCGTNGGGMPRGTKVGAPGFERCGPLPWCGSGDVLGPGERACGSYVATERRSIGRGDAPDAPAGEGDGPDDEPPPWKRRCRSIGALVAGAADGVVAGSVPKADGVPFLNEGGAAGDDERVAFLSPAVPNATASGEQGRRVSASS